ncbi:sigma-70 family RNA polymerase sigma factor [Streptomyces sp. NPDC002520]
MSEPTSGGDDLAALADRFETHRTRLRAVAYRMLGSAAEAEDAVQEAWFRLSRTDAAQVENLAAWLTTVVGRICLDMLRSRRTRAEDPLDTWHPAPSSEPDPAQGALLADSVGIALLVVLDTLTPAERLAFVLHDLFAVPFDEVAVVLGRQPAAARQLASRARRRVQGAEASDSGRDRQRELVTAFLAAARDGDFEGLLAVLDPDVVARSEAGVTTGATAVASGAVTYASFGRAAGVALVDGLPGAVVLDSDGRPERALRFTVVRDRIAVVEVVTDPERVAGLTVEIEGT